MASSACRSCRLGVVAVSSNRLNRKRVPPGQGRLFDDSDLIADPKDIGNVASSTADDQAPTVGTEPDADNDNAGKSTAVTERKSDAANQAQSATASSSYPYCKPEVAKMSKAQNHDTTDGKEMAPEDAIKQHWHRALHSEERLTQIRIDTLLDTLASAALLAADQQQAADAGGAR